MEPSDPLAAARELLADDRFACRQTAVGGHGLVAAQREDAAEAVGLTGILRSGTGEKTGENELHQLPLPCLGSSSATCAL